MSKMSFSLNCDQVPDYPTTRTWTDVLRWAVMVMDPDDTRLPFMASVLSQAIEKDGLSEKQTKACNRILASVTKDWMAGILVCQNTPAPDWPTADELEALGRAN